MLVVLPAGTGAAQTLHALEIQPPKALILNIGGAAELDGALTPQLVQLFSRAIAQAAIETEALILDGGIQARGTALIGQGVADRGQHSIRLGVAPADIVTYPGSPTDGKPADTALLDPTHSHFVLAEADQWGGEVGTMYALAQHLTTQAPALALLIRGCCWPARTWNTSAATCATASPPSWYSCITRRRSRPPRAICCWRKSNYRHSRSCS